ncbi:MAG: (5-formylfuran-3-yl)methyl phosphate synthase [Candidatus Helarchaeota archaeon]
MKLLVSPFNVEEAKIVIQSKVVDIVDVKNPLEGSLGANFPNVISDVVKLVKLQNNHLKASAAIGDLRNFPGTASLAALGAATLGLDYIKVGLRITDKDAVLYLMKKITKSVKDYAPNIKVVGATYADFERFEAINPSLLPDIVAESGADVAMIDTGIKNDGKNLFDFLSMEDLKIFLDNSRQNGIETALAGSLKINHLKKLKTLNPDIIGIRGAVCEKNDRVNGLMMLDKILQFKKEMN